VYVRCPSCESIVFRVGPNGLSEEQTTQNKRETMQHDGISQIDADSMN
jgi:hypothetical protein